MEEGMNNRGESNEVPIKVIMMQEEISSLRSKIMRSKKEQELWLKRKHYVIS